MTKTASPSPRASSSNPSGRQHNQPRKLRTAEKIAFDTLQRAIAAEGTKVPTHNHIPANAIVVPNDLWRRFYLAGTSTDDQSDYVAV